MEGNAQANDSFCDANRFPEVSRQCQDQTEEARLKNCERKLLLSKQVFFRFAAIFGWPLNGVYVHPNVKAFRVFKLVWFIARARMATQPLIFRKMNLFVKLRKGADL